MAEIKSFNDASVRMLRKEMEEAIQAVASKYGLKATGLGSIGYNPSTLTTSKITLAVAGTQMDIQNEPLESFIAKRFKQGSRTFTIVRVENGNLIGRTNRGAHYILTRDNLSKMVKL